MIIEELTVTAFQQHTRIVGCEKTKRAICIDPGDDSEAIVQAIDQHGFELQAIACTHAHMDHVGGVTALKKLKPAAKITIHPADEPLYLELPNQPTWLGIPRSQWTEYGFDYEQPPKADEYWSDGQIYKVGELSFQVIHCPGHTPGHVSYLHEKEKIEKRWPAAVDLPGSLSSEMIRRMEARISSMPPVESRWPATLMMSSVRPITKT